jgi:hypothetical protein
MAMNAQAQDDDAEELVALSSLSTLCDDTCRTVAEQHEAIDAIRRFSFEGDGGGVGHHKKSDPTDKDKCMKFKINYGWNLKFNLYMESIIYRWHLKSKFIF